MPETRLKLSPESQSYIGSLTQLDAVLLNICRTGSTLFKVKIKHDSWKHNTQKFISGTSIIHGQGYFQKHTLIILETYKEWVQIVPKCKIFLHLNSHLLFGIYYQILCKCIKGTIKKKHIIIHIVQYMNYNKTISHIYIYKQYMYTYLKSVWQPCCWPQAGVAVRISKFTSPFYRVKLLV